MTMNYRLEKNGKFKIRIYNKMCNKYPWTVTRHKKKLVATILCLKEF